MSELCLVTGGAGFIGSHLVEALLARGNRVRVLDDFSTGRRDNLPAGVEVLAGDLADADAVRAAADGASVVYHLGAIASVQRSIEDPPLIHRVCGTGTLNVFEAARRAGVRRIVYASSAAVYGIPDGPVQVESAALRPLSPYAAAKLAGEFYAQAFSACHGLETVSLRFFNVYGPRQRADSPYSGVIALFISALLAGRTPSVFGDGLQSRDFVAVEDVVQALTLAAEKPGASGKVYNVGTGRSVTLLDLLATLNTVLGTDVRPNHAPPRTGDIRHSRADIGRIRSDLGYEPRVSLEEGLSRTLEWYRRAG
jgi:UDP-glucose 4-epimerase